MRLHGRQDGVAQHITQKILGQYVHRLSAPALGRLHAGSGRVATLCWDPGAAPARTCVRGHLHGRLRTLVGCALVAPSALALLGSSWLGDAGDRLAAASTEEAARTEAPRANHFSVERAQRRWSHSLCRNCGLPPMEMAPIISISAHLPVEHVRSIPSTHSPPASTPAAPKR